MPYGSLYVGCEEHLDPAGTGSFYNEGEADIVVQHVFNLIYSGMHSFLLDIKSYDLYLAYVRYVFYLTIFSPFCAFLSSIQQAKEFTPFLFVLG